MTARSAIQEPTPVQNGIVRSARDARRDPNVLLDAGHLGSCGSEDVGSEFGQLGAFALLELDVRGDG